MNESNEMGSMKNPPHPGEILKGLYLEPLELTITKTAEVLGVTRKTLSQLINGHQAVSPEMALRLSEAFNTTPQLWLNLQQNYDLSQAERKKRTFVVRHFYASSQPKYG